MPRAARGIGSAFEREFDACFAEAGTHDFFTHVEYSFQLRLGGQFARERQEGTRGFEFGDRLRFCREQTFPVRLGFPLEKSLGANGLALGRRWTVACFMIGRCSTCQPRNSCDLFVTATQRDHVAVEIDAVVRPGQSHAVIFRHRGRFHSFPF